MYTHKLQKRFQAIASFKRTRRDPLKEGQALMSASWLQQSVSRKIKLDNSQ